MKQAVKLASVVAFGWRIIKMQLPAGKSYGLMVSRDLPRSVLGTFALFTEGRIEGVNLSTGEALDVRTRGTFTGQLGELKPGLRRLTAVQDTTWWCVDRRANDGQLPDVTARELAAGETATGLVLVCEGPDDGYAFAGEYTASAPTLVLIFGSEK